MKTGAERRNSGWGKKEIGWVGGEREWARGGNDLARDELGGFCSSLQQSIGKTKSNRLQTKPDKKNKKKPREN